MYFSSANCVIKLGLKDSSYLEELEDLVGVNVSETEQVLPIYGWRDREYSKVGKGNILATGSIIYNANIPLYLERILLPQSYERVTYNSSRNRDYYQNELAYDKQSDMVGSRVRDMASDLTGKDDVPDLQLLLQVARLHKKYNYPSTGITMRDTLSNVSEENLPRLSDIEAMMQIKTPNSIYKISSITFNSTATEVQGGSASNIKLARGFIAKRFYEV